MLFSFLVIMTGVYKFQRNQRGREGKEKEKEKGKEK